MIRHCHVIFVIFIKSFLVKMSQRELELEKPGVYMLSISDFYIVKTIICKQKNEFKAHNRYV